MQLHNFSMFAMLSCATFKTVLQALKKADCMQLSSAPPPSMMTPVLRGGAFIASSFMALMSAMMSSINPGFLNVWKYSMSPREPSVSAGQ